MENTSAVIERIRRMELYFDIIRYSVKHNPSSVVNDPLICEILKVLTDYYENGQWMKDFECDERHELPSDLKRGVLSEDGMYDLLCAIKELM